MRKQKGGGPKREKRRQQRTDLERLHQETTWCAELQFKEQIQVPVAKRVAPPSGGAAALRSIHWLELQQCLTFFVKHQSPIDQGIGVHLWQEADKQLFKSHAIPLQAGHLGGNEL
jgi:hypothetical protein